MTYPLFSDEQEKKINTRKKSDYKGIWNFSKIPRKISEEREREKKSGRKREGIEGKSKLEKIQRKMSKV
jgi:hypothetical protein